MNRRPPILLPAFALFLAAVGARAGNLHDLGFTALRAAHPQLTGAGQTVAQPEAGGTYQVNPAAVGQPAGRFRYYDSTHPYGTAGAAFSAASGHANNVGANLYGASTGGAPGVATVENFEAGYFVNDIVIHLVTAGGQTTWEPVAIASPIVNQSFIFDASQANDIASINAFYDAYANEFGTLFVDGLNNGPGSLTNAPASMFNGLAVGRVDGSHSGRAQLVAPGGETSYATPYVSAAAAVLRQAATLGDFQALSGVSAAEARVLKAGLLNGATKTAGWTHTPTDPLDATVGAGVVNVKGAYDTLAGGQHARSSANLTARNAVGTAATFTAPVGAAQGWDLRSLTAQASADAVAHYFFDLTARTALTLTATLTWNSLVDLDAGPDRLSNFDLVLVDALSHAIVWRSASTTQNVEQIYLTNLAGSKYDLQVILRGGAGAPAATDTYAAAWSWQSAAPTPVPETGFVWILGAAGLAFIARKRLARSRPPSRPAL